MKSSELGELYALLHMYQNVYGGVEGKLLAEIVDNYRMDDMAEEQRRDVEMEREAGQADTEKTEEKFAHFFLHIFSLYKSTTLIVYHE